MRRYRRSQQLATERLEKRKALSKEPEDKLPVDLEPYMEDELELDSGSSRGALHFTAEEQPVAVQPATHAPTIHINPAFLPVDAYHGVQSRSVVL